MHHDLVTVDDDDHRAVSVVVMAVPVVVIASMVMVRAVVVIFGCVRFAVRVLIRFFDHNEPIKVPELSTHMARPRPITDQTRLFGLFDQESCIAPSGPLS